MDYKKAAGRFGEHVVDSTALIVAAQPIFAVFDTVAGITPDVSIDSKLYASAFTYLGIGSW